MFLTTMISCINQKPPRRPGHKILLEANQIAFTFPARIQVPELKGNELNQRARLTDRRWGSNSIAPSEWGKIILHVDSGTWPWNSGEKNPSVHHSPPFDEGKCYIGCEIRRTFDKQTHDSFVTKPTNSHV